MSFPRNESYQFDEFVLNRFSRTLLRAGEPVTLSPKAFEVLTQLVINPGRVVTKDELLKAVWPDSFVEESNLAQHISALRKAFGDRAACIATVPGRGYQFTAPVHVTSQIQEPTATVFPDLNNRDVLVQRVRERTHVIVEESSPMPVIQPRTTTQVLSTLAAALAIVAVASTLGWKHFAPTPKFQKVMIADFLNATNDPSMDHTLSSALTFGLEQTPYIQLMGGSAARASLKLMQKPSDTPLLGDVALEVCRRNNYQALLRGKIENAAPGYNLTLDEVGCASGKTLAEFKGNADNKDAILDTLDELALTARRKLGEPKETVEEFQVPITDASTFSFEALNDYNIGARIGNEGNSADAIPYFEKAVELDPKFALANASLGTAYYNLGSSDKANTAYTKAFDLSGNITQYEKLFIRSNYYLVLDRDLNKAAKIFEEWTKTYPNDETAWAALDNADSQIGKYAEAIQAGEHGLQIGTVRRQMFYEILADSYKEASRFADAKRIIAIAQAQGKDSPRMHQILYEIAIVERDPETLQREMEWAKDKPEHYRMLQFQAYLAADEGKVRLAEDLYDKAIAEAKREIPGNFSDRMLFSEAELETQLGRDAKARELLKQVQNLSGAAPVAVMAEAGDIAAGDAYLRKPEEYPKDSIEHDIRVPQLKALVDLGHKNPTAALAVLQPAASMELTRPDLIRVHAEAYMAAHQPQKAAEEYQKLIDNPGIESPELPQTVLAHLGLARALAMENNLVESRVEYEKFLQLWQDADSDLPVFQQAQAEYAHLTEASAPNAKLAKLTLPRTQ